MTFTDYLRLSEHKIFKAIRDTLPKPVKKAQNVLIIKDDVLFAWDFESNCVLTLNVKSFRSREGDNVIYQVGLLFCIIVCINVISLWKGNRMIRFYVVCVCLCEHNLKTRYDRWVSLSACIYEGRVKLLVPQSVELLVRSAFKPCWCLLLPEY